MSEPKTRVAKLVSFEPGEREKLYSKIKASVRYRPRNARDMASAFGVPTHKLRQVLYSLKRRGDITLSLDGHKCEGMTVTRTQPVEAVIVPTKKTSKGKP